MRLWARVRGNKGALQRDAESQVFVAMWGAVRGTDQGVRGAFQRSESEPTVTVKEGRTVDWLALEKGTGRILLTVVDDLDWTDEAGHLFVLQEKLDTYLAFIESGEVFERLLDTLERPVPKERLTLEGVPSTLETSLEGTGNQPKSPNLSHRACDQGSIVGGHARRAQETRVLRAGISDVSWSFTHRSTQWYATPAYAACVVRPQGAESVGAERWT